jgi:hypothetical protein
VQPSACKILDIAVAEIRIKQILPVSYAEDLCDRAKKKLAECLILSKHESKSKKIFQKLTQNTIFYPSFSNNAHLLLPNDLTFPYEVIHEILTKLFECKFNMSVSYYLTSVLEDVASDILSRSSCLARNCNKLIVSKREVTMTIDGQPTLSEIFNSCCKNGIPHLKFCLDEIADIDDEDFIENLNDDTTLGITNLLFGTKFGKLFT